MKTYEELMAELTKQLPTMLSQQTPADYTIDNFLFELRAPIFNEFNHMVKCSVEIELSQTLGRHISALKTLDTQLTTQIRNNLDNHTRVHID